jgi:opacity protein-like surface antigen
MRKMRFRTFTSVALGVLTAALLIATPAVSEEEESRFARNGPYVGGNIVGASFVRLDQRGDLEGDEVAGFNLYGGYRLTPVLAIEVQYEWLDKTDLHVDGTGDVGNLEIWSASANLKVFFWTERFQPYAVVGFGGMGADFEDSSGLGLGIGGTESDLAFRFGAGLDFYVTEHIVASAGANYLLPGGSELEDFDYVSYGGGIQYRF